MRTQEERDQQTLTIASVVFGVAALAAVVVALVAIIWTVAG